MCSVSAQATGRDVPGGSHEPGEGRGCDLPIPGVHARVHAERIAGRLVIGAPEQRGAGLPLQREHGDAS